MIEAVRKERGTGPVMMLSNDKERNVDAMNVFKSMEPYKLERGSLEGAIGEGPILIGLPDNGLMNFILGDTNAIRITEADFLGLKSISTE